MFKPTPGDIVLTRGPGKPSTLNVIGQWALWRRSSFSHARVAVSENVWCEAMPGLGVQFLRTSDAFPTDQQEGSWRVLRPTKHLEGLIELSELELAERWKEAARRFCGLPFNYGIHLPKTARIPSTTFCSELVVRMYKAVGSGGRITESRPEFVLPGDLERLEKTDSWANVTSEYQSYLNTCREDPSWPEVEKRDFDWTVKMQKATAWVEKGVIQNMEIEAHADEVMRIGEVMITGNLLKGKTSSDLGSPHNRPEFSARLEKEYMAMVKRVLKDQKRTERLLNKLKRSDPES